MKLLLIKPPITYYKTESEYSPYEPLGLMYLASYLREYSSDVEVKILDASARPDLTRWEGDFFKVGHTDEMITKAIADYQPDIVGISSMFTINSKGVHDTAKLVKQSDRRIPVIVGGAHASAFPEWVLKDENIDIVVTGEGEETLLDIVNRLKTEKPIYDLTGLAYRDNGTVKSTGLREFIKDLDTVPPPARDLVDMNVYFYEKYNYSHSMSPPRSTVVSSRGCPYRCIFCSIHSLWRHSYRMRSPQNVVDEIETLVRDYGVREIAFFDDNLSVSKKRMIEICDEIIRRKLNIKWCTPNGIAIWTLDKEVVLKMRESGCYKLTFGIETGSLATQKFIRKSHIDLEKSKELIKYCNKIGIWTHSPFIIGFPYETEKDIMDTIDYALNCGIDMATFFIATPYPGTEMYDIYRQENLLPDLGDEKSLAWLGAVGRSMCNTKHFTSKQIEDFISMAQRKVFIKRAISFLNPLKILPKIMGKDEFKYFSRQVVSYSKRLSKSLLR
jgi:magnesium-protoporphyrin IX monomethyl ester (oxidative) cyclase